MTDLEYGNDQRFVERRLHAGDTAHVYGGVTQADVGEWGDSLVAAVVADTGATDRFVVSDGTERWTALRLSKWWLLLAAGSLLSLLAGLWALVDVLAGPV